MTAQTSSPLRLLGDRRFWPLFGAQALGAFNDQVFKTGFVALITYRLADLHGLNAGFHNAFAAGLFILPFALFAPTAGQIADGMDKGLMMKRVKALEILLMIFGAVAYQMQNLTLLYALLFLMGAQSAIFSPIKYGILPQYLKPGELVAGNGLIQAATFLAILVGQIAGAKLILSEAGVTIISVMVILVAIAGWLFSLKTPPAPPLGATAPKVDWVFPRAVWEVLKETRRNRPAFKAILNIAWFWFLGATYMALVLPFAKDSLGANEDVSVILLAAFSIGVAVGSAACARLYKGEARVDLAGWAAVGMAVLAILLFFAVKAYRAEPLAEALMGPAAFWARDWAWAILLCFVGLAAAAGLYITPLNARMQISAEPEARGRVVAASNVADSLLMVLSSAAAMGMTAAGLSHEAIFALVGATGFVAALWVAADAPQGILGRLGRAVGFGERG
ncbi:MFS transporter [Neomegalonema perideroedes]|uniref:MFS transporter n=1 Tax=Neomegalonema perideroedes TaxID=217219 RepID=UPI0003814B46|nr:MFS transporter [Neomegalonema perideroedes]